MTPARARAMYMRQLAAYGETITLRRNATAPFIDANVRARVTGYEPHQLVGGIQQGDREIVVLAADLETAGWPVPPRTNDKAIVRGRVLNVQSADDSTVRVGDTIVAYLLQVRG